MSLQRNKQSIPGGHANLLGELAIPLLQLQSVNDPGLGTRDLLATASRTGGYIGRPYMVWKNDPELARVVNDHLCRGRTD